MCLCLERMHDRRSLSALKLLKVCKDSNIHLYFSLDHFLLQFLLKLWLSCFYLLHFIICFSHFLFSPCTNKQKRSCLQSVSIPALPIWSSPQRLRQLFSRGRGGGTDIIVVMTTDGCAPFTKTNFACSLKKRLRHTSAAEHLEKTCRQIRTVSPGNTELLCSYSNV